MIRSKAMLWGATTILLLLCLMVAVGISLTIGELKLSVFDIPKIFSEGQGSIEHTIMFNIRLPRVILGIAVGGALSLAGVLLQGVYRNPLVEPYTLGISGGAALGVSLHILFKLNRITGTFGLPLSGFAGAIFFDGLLFF